MNASRLATLTLVVLLSACASKTQTRATTAAATPLSDLNLMRDEIPEVLQEALKKPYLLPPEQTCPTLVGEVHKLDIVLGADLDTPESEDNPSLLDRGTDAAENTAIGAIQRTAEGLVPFRSWVRKLTGAERHSRKVAASITAGSIRRAFLKGVAASHGCVLTPPAQLAASSTPVTPGPGGASPGEAPPAQPVTPPRPAAPN